MRSESAKLHFMNDHSATIAGRAFPGEWVTCPTPFLDGREKAVDRLLYGLFHHQRIQLLSGPAGAGKSIALRRLEKRLRNRLLTLCVDAADIDGQDELLRMIAEATDSHIGETGAASSPASRVNAISKRLRQLADNGQRVVLLLDNAEQLDAHSLSSLLELAQTQATPSPGALGIVLACLPEFAAEHTDRRHWEPLPLRPLSVTGTGRYLQARLCRAGIRGHGPFSRAVVEDIHAQSGGWPGNIDQQAREILGDASHNLLHTEIRLGRRSATLAILLVLVIVAALGGWYRQPLRELITDSGIDFRPSGSISSPWTNSTEAASPTTIDATPPTTPSADISTNSATITGSIVGTGDDSAGQQPSQHPVSSQPAVEPTAMASTTASTTPPKTLLQTEQAAGQKRQQIVASDPTATAASLKPAVTPAAAPTPTPVPAPQPAPKPAPTSAPRGAIVHLQNWIEQQAAQRWTLQVFTAHSESHLLNLVTRSGIAGDWAYYHIHQDNKDWYTLLYGSFTRREAAVQAIPRLKPLFGKPLLRNYHSIHKSLGIGPSE